MHELIIRLRQAEESVALYFVLPATRLSLSRRRLVSRGYRNILFLVECDVKLKAAQPGIAYFQLSAVSNHLDQWVRATSWRLLPNARRMLLESCIPCRPNYHVDFVVIYFCTIT